jgi:CheY-like chemotaxis protein
MIAEEIEQELRDALTHLYDPDYQPSEVLYELTGCENRSGALAVQTALIQAIEALKPPVDVPSSSHLKQAYDLLRNRFILKLTLEETAERMHMSFSSTWRTQRSAVHTLARALWEHNQAQQRSTAGREGGRPSSEKATFPSQALDWHSQTKQELASLMVNAPGTVSNVRQTIEGVVDLLGTLASKRDVRVEVKFIQPNLIASVHPSVLRQILITAARRMALHTTTGQISIYAGLEDGNVKITITSTVVGENPPAENDLVRDLLIPEGASVEVQLEGDHIYLGIKLPSVGAVTVLIVDDNLDMARFYRRCTEGTSYRVVHITQGQTLFETLETTKVDVVVLDVMLPDVDGWELLMRLHEDPATRDVPVVVCSVVREEELALSLGATRYLPKPVRPHQFIQALNQVLSQAPAKEPGSPTNNAVMY